MYVEEKVYTYLSIERAVHYDLFEQPQTGGGVDLIQKYLQYNKYITEIPIYIYDHIMLAYIGMVDSIMYTRTVTKGRRRESPVSSPCTYACLRESACSMAGWR